QMLESEYSRLNLLTKRDSVCHPDVNAECDSLVVIVGDLFTFPGESGNFTSWASGSAADITLSYRTLDAVDAGNCGGGTTPPVTPPVAECKWLKTDSLIAQSGMLDIFPGTGLVNSTQRGWFVGPPSAFVRGSTYQMLESEYSRLNLLTKRDSVCHPDVNAECDSLVVIVGDLFTFPGESGNFTSWASGSAADITLSYRTLDAVEAGNCSGGSKSIIAGPQQSAPTPTQETMPCRRVLQRDPIPHTNAMLMYEYVDVFYGDESAGDIFQIQEQFLGNYYTIDSSCSWDYECDSIILIAGDNIRATRTPPSRTRDLVRSWNPEVVYTRDVIVSNCKTTQMPPVYIPDQYSAAAQPIAVKSITLPSDGDWTTAERVNDPSFDIPYPNLMYYSQTNCRDTIIYTRIELWIPAIEEFVTEIISEVRGRHCEPVGPIGDFLANVTCEGVEDKDANFLVCDSIYIVDSVKFTHTVVDVFDLGFGEIIYECRDSVSYRVDSIWSYKCWKDCPDVMVCDTMKISGDTIINYIEDSIVIKIDTHYLIGNDYPQKLCPVLDTMNIVMELETESGRTLRDTFQVVRLNIPREFTRDTFISQGDTLHLFAQGLDPDQNVTQWWVDLSGSYFNSNPNDLVLGSSAHTANGFRPNTPFVGDTTPIDRNPEAFRGDTVDMMLVSQHLFELENYDMLCTTRDTVAIRIMNGFRIEGYVSYDSFWMPTIIAVQDDLGRIQDEKGVWYYPHRPVGGVKIDLLRISTQSVVATTVSQSDGYFNFEGAYPPDQYVLVGTAPEKYIVLNADGGVTANDAALLNRWIVDRPSMPYVEEQNPMWTKKTMMYLASNVDENTILPVHYFGINANDVQQIMNATVRNFQFPRNVPLGGGVDYSTGSFFSELLDGTGALAPVDDWKFSLDTIDLTAHITEHHMYAVMMGDADLSYYPIGGHAEDVMSKAKSSSSAAPKNPTFDLFDTIFVNSRDQFINYPVLAKQDGELGAMQLWLNMPSDVEILNVTPGGRTDMRLAQNILGNDVFFSWITNSSKPIEFKKGDVIANLVMKVNRPSARVMRQIPDKITFTPVGYGAYDGNQRNVTEQFEVALPIIVVDNTLAITVLDSIIDDEEIYDTTSNAVEGTITVNGAEVQTSKIINVIPNPMSDRADVTYSLVEESIVTLKLLNLLGVEVKTIINAEHQDVGIFRQGMSADDIPSGVYILRLETISKGKRNIAIEKIVVNK
ncbi:MAG: hypothetical protein FWG79_06015, partial [Bacteroidales bacterium]|nr:hypothetical protein [Bacteroidales bacterium]